jgi:hypothetical protein
MFDSLVKSLKEEIKRIREKTPAALIEMRSLHRNGGIWVVEYDKQKHCFAVTTDGKIHHDRHENLISLFSRGE